MSTEEFLKYLEGYLEPLKEKIDCLEETIKLIKEKMIKPNSDSIEKLEENVNRNWNLNQELAQEIMPNYVDKELSELKEKITWLSEENAKLYTQLDNDALKRATNTDVLQKFFQVMIAYSCNEISDEIPPLLKRLSGATDLEGEKSVPKGETVYLEKPSMVVKLAPHCASQNSKPSYGCFLFTYCSEYIVAFDDCKIKDIQQVVVEKEDLEKAIVHGCIICYDSEECEKGRINKEVCDIWNLKKYAK